MLQDGSIIIGWRRSGVVVGITLIPGERKERIKRGRVGFSEFFDLFSQKALGSSEEVSSGFLDLTSICLGKAGLISGRWIKTS